MPGTSSINGIVSGFNTESIVGKMMEYAKQTENKLVADNAECANKQSVWQGLNTQILALKNKIDTLAVPGAFTQCTANSSDMTVIQATAGTSATPGTYYLKVKSRAQGHQVAAVAKGGTAFTSTTADIGTGTISFAFANDPTKSFDVTVDGTNNTLQGVRDTINRMNKGVQASIINSGTSSSPAYQLVLSTTGTGTKSQFTATGTEGMKIDFSTVIQQGADAEIEMGGGGTGAVPITVKKDSNTFDDLIPGVSLNILNPNTDKTIKVTVGRNTEVLKSSIQDFVTSYNALTDAIDAQFQYDAKTGKTGTLMGDWDLQSIQAELSRVVGGVVSGVNKNFSALSTIGISKDMDGHLQINDATLTKALTEHPDDVSRLFASNMSSDSTYVSYATSTADTQASPAAGWQVNITQPAKQAQLTASVAMTGGLGADETLTLSSSSGSGKTIALKKDWTLDRVVAEINANSATTGVTAVATAADGTVSANAADNTYLTLRSVRYGSAATVSARSSLSNGGGNTTGLGDTLVEGAKGVDVAGTINGETCKGSGQLLTSSSTGATKGLSITVTATSAMQTQVHFTKGVGTNLRDTIVGMNGTNGILKRVQTSLQKRIDFYDKAIADEEVRLKAKEDRLYTQFNAMETQLAKLQDQNSYLTQQINAMNKSLS